MQGQARLLQKPNRFPIKTKHQARARIEAAPVSGHRVLIGLHDVRFRDTVNGIEQVFDYKAGTGFMYSGEKEIYQIFPGGMYQMMRSKRHATRGEHTDSKDMRGMTQLAFDFITRLRTWTLIGDEGKFVTDDGLRALANQLGHPKRAEPKLAASDHFRKASELRTDAHAKRMPMPSVFTADAGAQQLEQRRADVEKILRWIDPERLRVFSLVEGVHLRLDDAWRVFCPEAFAQHGHAVVLASANPTSHAVKVLRHYLDPIYRGLREIRVRPLNGLATQVVVALETLRGKIMDASGPVDVTDEVRTIRAALTAMRLVRELEMDVITPLSMQLGGWKHLGDRHEQVRLRVAETCHRFGESFQSKAEFLPSDRQAEVMRMMGLASRHAGTDDGNPRKHLLRVKAVLKHLSLFLSAPSNPI